MRFASLLLFAMGAVVAGIYYSSKNRTHLSGSPEKIKSKTKEQPKEKGWSDQEVDERLDESFPASDPPSWSSSHLH